MHILLQFPLLRCQAQIKLPVCRHGPLLCCPTADHHQALSSGLKSRDQRSGIPVSPHGLNGATVIELEYIDPFTCYHPAVCADPAHREFDGGAIPVTATYSSVKPISVNALATFKKN